MESKDRRTLNLIEQGKGNWERTGEFQTKVDEVRQQISAKYNLILSEEKNWFKRQLIRFRRMIELKKRIEEISSWENLHIASY